MNRKKLDISKNLLTEFMDKFFGYGNLNSPYWFIGKEEGGGNSLEENLQRILTWKEFGKTNTVDLIEYHNQLKVIDFNINKIQQTWTKICLILLEIQGQNSDTESRRFCQQKELGRILGNNCLLELMPLAAKSVGSRWYWGDVFEEYFGISKRKDYFSLIAPQRTKSLRGMIAKYHPKLVLFYSTDKIYLDIWSEIVGGAKWDWIHLSKSMKYALVEKDGCLYVVTTHPTMKGITNNNFSEVGKSIKKLLNF